MKRLIIAQILLLVLAATFQSDSTGGWVQQTLPTSKPITDIYFADSLHGWLSVSSGQVYDSAKILATSDGGNTWVTQFAKDTLILNAIQFLNLNTGYCVGGFQEVLKTTNAGQNWVSVNIPPEYYTDLCFVNTDTGWICSPYSFGGVFKTTNGGANWQPELGASYLIKKLFFINKDTGWASSNELNSRLFRTINGGTNWSLQHLFTGSAGRIFFVNRDTGFIATDIGNTTISRTTDGGFSWDSTSGSHAGKDLFFVNDKYGWASDVFSLVQRTTNGGINWFRQTVPSGYYYSIQFTDSLHGWSGGTNLIHTTDGGGPPVGIVKTNTTVNSFSLKQNYPNPFNPVTLIFFDLPENSRVDLRIYNILGEEVAKIFNDEFFTVGTVQYGFDADEEGLSSGVYFYRIAVMPENKDVVYTDTKKMVFLK